VPDLPRADIQHCRHRKQVRQGRPEAVHLHRVAPEKAFLAFREPWRPRRRGPPRTWDTCAASFGWPICSSLDRGRADRNPPGDGEWQAGLGRHVQLRACAREGKRLRRRQEPVVNCFKIVTSNWSAAGLGNPGICYRQGRASRRARRGPTDGIGLPPAQPILAHAGTAEGL
jgi:hypothetical protein